MCAPIAILRQTLTQPEGAVPNMQSGPAETIHVLRLFEDDPTDTPGLDESNPLSVSQLTLCLKRLIEGSLPSVWLEAEISDLSRPASGHYYMTLKE